MKKYNQFHDGVLEGPWIEGSTIHLFLRTTKGTSVTLVANGTKALNAGPFRPGNIVFDVVIRDASDATMADIVET